MNAFRSANASYNSVSATGLVSIETAEGTHAVSHAPLVPHKWEMASVLLFYRNIKIYSVARF